MFLVQYLCRAVHVLCNCYMNVISEVQTYLLTYRCYANLINQLSTHHEVDINFSLPNHQTSCTQLGPARTDHAFSETQLDLLFNYNLPQFIEHLTKCLY